MQRAKNIISGHKAAVCSEHERTQTFLAVLIRIEAILIRHQAKKVFIQWDKQQNNRNQSNNCINRSA